MSDLIERLRAQSDIATDGVCSIVLHELEEKGVTDLPSILQRMAIVMDEAADEIERLRGKLRRYEDAHWAEMSDEDMGRAFKAFAQTVTDWSETEWRDEGERRLGLMQMGLMQAVRMAAESNAETFSTTYSGFHSGGIQYGDWAVTIARPQPPTDRKEA